MMFAIAIVVVALIGSGNQPAKSFSPISRVCVKGGGRG